MIDEFPLPGFDVDGIRVWEDAASPGTWYWLPGAPTPLLNADGRAQADLIEAGELLFVTIGARWTVPAAELEALPRQIAQRLGDTDPASLNLVPAPTKVTRVEVLQEQDGTTTVLATGKASGFGSNDASLALSLQGDQARRFKDAAHGSGGHVFIQYQIEVEAPRWARATLRGSVPPPANGEASGDASASIREALSRGALEWTRTAAPDASAELRAAAEERAVELAAESLERIRRDSDAVMPPAPTDVEADAMVTEPRTVALTRAADLADWFKA
jgi:hypothetical protein